MQIASKSVECLILPLYIGFILGMFKGIEINHPGMIKTSSRDTFMKLDNYVTIEKY
jgi:hypothetical protein